MTKTLTVATLIELLKDVPQDYEVVVEAHEKPITRSERGNSAAAEARKVQIADTERAAYIIGREV